jgi:signal transduction histidine kinase
MNELEHTIGYIRIGKLMNSQTSSLEQIEAQASRRQQIAFCILTLFVIAALLLLHTLFADLLGEPSREVILLLGLGFLLKMLEALWLQGRHDGISERTARIESALSIVGILILTGCLAFLTNRDDSPYFVLLAIPILQCAYHLGLAPTILTVGAAVSMIFAWNWHYFAEHPPSRPTEYLQSGMISVIFGLMGPLVWYLVTQLKQNESQLYEKMEELETARERLLAEEKLAAVGRLASGIAHEIRNPVAMIASSLSTAAYPAADASEREEMYGIAAREAKRLEELTTDFLKYARPSRPQKSPIAIGDILHHIADVTRMRATSRSISVTCEAEKDDNVEADATQIEGALLNLALNAIEATPNDGHVQLRNRADGTMMRIEVENSGNRIPDEHVERIFEPFYTTRSNGTGLGLAIARGVAIAHGGNLWVSSNMDGSVVFAMTLTRQSTDPELSGGSNGQGTDC